MNKLSSEEFDKRVEHFFKYYQDRGMKKWSGFFLSDHSLKINKKKMKLSMIYTKRPEMSQIEISEVLLTAFSEHYPISIQLKELDEDGNLLADIVGYIDGYCGTDTIIISENRIELDNVNNVEIIE